MNSLFRRSSRLYSTMAASSNPASSPFTQAVVSSMRKLYPESLADKSWDNTGLLLEAPFNASRRQKNSVLLAIDLTKAVADEAIARRDSIVVAYRTLFSIRPCSHSTSKLTHLSLVSRKHTDPIIFRGLKSLTFTDPQQQTLLRLASEGISVYSPHTAIDATPGGMADWLCDIVTGAIITPATPTKPTLTQSSSATYSHPVYPAPQPATQATKVPKHTRHTILPSPPPLPEGVEDTAGMGRIVTFTDPEPLTAIIDRIAQGVGFPGGIPIAIPQGASVDALKIRTVGVCPGSGSGVLMKKSPIPDLLFTGELSHHEALAAIERGSVVVALAHSNTERGYLRAVMREKLAKEVEETWRVRREEGLQQQKDAEGGLKEVFADGSCEVAVSEKDRDPYGIMVRQG
ncbi:Nif3-like dinuclear metal center hexameric protein [Aspergillus fijiensis CBS 313.89]|uniref:Putative NGG1 interacting factor Nif3 n=1 Tax=Aspergillus fijiensis CBS 313.89 TaxID=1448319 RepID=A0A8G1RQQ7_9EURO|nr:putative NGG1 interacting factor Nif3 [Aspergillus fijiensis CBS 313.89]RAK76180.1 putative NGG1 interacting factor Nif3 [Aspergillus fijiensis CBS 313.89]